MTRYSRRLAPAQLAVGPGNDSAGTGSACCEEWAAAPPANRPLWGYADILSDSCQKGGGGRRLLACDEKGGS